MALFHSTSPVNAAGTAHQVTTLFFTTNAAGAVIEFGGSYVLNVVQTGVGTYLVTWGDFSPDNFMWGGFQDLAANVRVVRFGKFTFAPQSVQVTAVVYVHNPSGGLINGVERIRGLVQWKMFSGRDASGL